MTRMQGEVLMREWKSGRGYALRFCAYGERQYVTLGVERDGWERALRTRLALAPPSAKESARPSPRLAPVIQTTRSSKRR